nr:hypothetical protein [uncultured Holophaga sp.]
MSADTTTALATPATSGAVQEIRLGFDTLEGFRSLQRAATMFSASILVPKEYQGEKGVASCAIALDLAARINASPLMVMQNLYIVQGRPGWSAKFKIATFNKCGRFSPIRYEFTGQEGSDEWGCRAVAIEKATGEQLQGPLVTIGLAKKEGWYAKGGSKWQTMPEQMLRYRSASWFIDTVAPELSMGLPTSEDIEDIQEPVIDMETGEVVTVQTRARDITPSAGRTPGMPTTTWPIPSLEQFDTLMEQAYSAFQDAGLEQGWPVFQDKWRPRRGVGDDKLVLRDLGEDVARLLPPDGE